MNLNTIVGRTLSAENASKRVEQVDRQLTIITNRMDRFMFWSLGLTVIAIVKLT